MGRQPGFFDVEERLRELSAKGDDLERLSALVDFEVFRPELERAVPRSDRAKGGRPPYDHVLMFKVLILQASHSLSDERTEYLIKDRPSFMRFLGLSLADRVPDANSIWNFREALTRARIGGTPAIEVLFRRFDAMLGASGYNDQPFTGLARVPPSDAGRPLGGMVKLLSMSCGLVAAQAIVQVEGDAEGALAPTGSAPQLQNATVSTDRGAQHDAAQSIVDFECSLD